MTYFKQINTKPNRLYTFDNYFNDQEEIALLIKDLTSGSSKSLVISGKNGCGVTHLLNAICNKISGKNKKTFLITAQWLLHIYKQLKTENDKKNLIKYLGTYDVIAIDNIQFLYRKTKDRSTFIADIIKQCLSKKQTILIGCSDPAKDITRSKKYMKDVLIDRLELRQLNSLNVFRSLKHLCSPEDAIPDNLIYAISGYNGSIQQYINCLISIRFKIRTQNIDPNVLSAEQFDRFFDLKKYFPQQQFRKCFKQTQLSFMMASYVRQLEVK